jgi:hypothetical protein
MATLLQIDFPFAGPFGEALAEQPAELAASIAQEPGLIWKLWTENALERSAGGIDLFSDEASARPYLHKHQLRLEGLGIAEIRARVFTVNAPLSRSTHALLEA